MIGGGYGINKEQKSFLISYQRFLSNKLSYKGNVEYSLVSFQVSNYSSFAINPEGYYTIFSNYKNIYLNAKAGAHLGFESISNEAFGNKKRTYYGQAIGTSCEFFFTHNFKTELGIEQRFIQKSLISSYSTHYYISIYLAIN
jgi:hypothetical protein